MAELAQLQELQQDRGLGQIGDDDSGFVGRDALQFNVEVGRPFALELFAGEGQALVCGFDVPQGSAGEDHTEERSHDGRDHGDVADERAPRDAERIHHLHCVHEAKDSCGRDWGRTADGDECN